MELLEEIAFGEMGMLEEEFDNCTPRYFVARLNGLRSFQKVERTFQMQMVREICFYAGNGGNFKKGVKRNDIFRLPGERELDKLRTEEMIRNLEKANWLASWKKPKFND